MKTIKYLGRLLVMGLVLIATACGNDGQEAVTKPKSEDAAFTYTVDAENQNKLFFHIEPNESNWYVHWDFGDGSAAEGIDASKIFSKKGTYQVRCKIFTKAGTAESIQAIIIEDDYLGPNVLQNGKFDNSDGWTIVNFGEESTSFVTIADGVAKFDMTSSPDWWGIGMYSTLTLEPGAYKFDMEMTFEDVDGIWGEVYIGASEPIEGITYNGDQMVMKAFNAWECNTTYSGLASEFGCDTNTAVGQFNITTAGTYYLMFRTGGYSYGKVGIVIDNVTLVKTN